MLTWIASGILTRGFRATMSDHTKKTKEVPPASMASKPLLPRLSRAELVWDGKYDSAGRRVSPLRVALPFQTVETVNESAQERQRSLFTPGFREEEWRNRLIWGDKKYVLPSLLSELAGKVNLIYIDPPFDTGADFSFTATVPDDPETSGDDSFTFTKEPSIIEHKAYRDTWGRGLESYLQWFYETALMLHELLREDGSIYVHLDYHVVHYAKPILDEIFGSDNFLNQIIWKRTASHSEASRCGNVNDVLLFYAKGDQHTLNRVFQPYNAEYVEQYYRYKDSNGRRFMSDNLTGAGDGPARIFGERGSLPPPKGRHWMYDQKGIDRLIQEDRIF